MFLKNINFKNKFTLLTVVGKGLGRACFIASSAAAMITGTSLLVDGGWTAQ